MRHISDEIHKGMDKCKTYPYGYKRYVVSIVRTYADTFGQPYKKTVIWDDYLNEDKWSAVEAIELKAMTNNGYRINQ